MRSILQARAPRGDSLLAVPAELGVTTRRQAGVVTRDQLARGGFTPRHVDAAVAARRWQSFGRRVVVLHNAALSQRQREWVAVLLAGKPCGLAGLSAAALDGLAGFATDQVHIVVAHATHIAAPQWVKVHESRRFAVGDLRHAAGPPRTRCARSLIDAATWSPSPRRACAILCGGVQQRLVTAGRLRCELSKAGHIRHVQILSDILGDISGGGHTLAEIELGPLAHRAGLPAPRRQVLRREPTGKIRYVDAEIDLPDGELLVIEIDGAVHLRPKSWWDDSDRQNEIVIAGSRVLRFPSLTIRLDPDRVVDQLARMRRAHTCAEQTCPPFETP